MFSKKLNPSPNTGPLNYYMPTALSLDLFRNCYTQISTTQTSMKIQKNNSNFHKVCKEYVSFPDKINSTRQIFDKARRRIELCFSGNLKEREGKWNRAQTVIYVALKNRRHQILRRCRAWTGLWLAHCRFNPSSLRRCC